MKNKDMKTIMEGWRSYKKNISQDREFYLVLESIKKTTDVHSINEIVDSWIHEQEKILAELNIAGAVAKGAEWIDTKINNFMIQLFFKGASLIESAATAGLKFLSPAIKILKFISGKIHSFSAKHPFIARASKVMLIALVMICAVAVLTGAAAAGEQISVEVAQGFIDTLQGLLTDHLGGSDTLFAGPDVYPDAAPGSRGSVTGDSVELGEKLRDAINHLETINFESDESVDIKGLIERVKANNNEMIIDLFNEMKDNPNVTDEVQEQYRRIGGEIAGVDLDASVVSGDGYREERWTMTYLDVLDKAKDVGINSAEEILQKAETDPEDLVQLLGIEDEVKEFEKGAGDAADRFKQGLDSFLDAIGVK